MDFIDDPLDFYPDWYLDPNFDPRILDLDEDLIPPGNIYWMTNVHTKEEMEEKEKIEKEINEGNYDVFPALSPSGEPTNIKLYVLKESKIYTPFKSLEEVEKVVKELNKDQNK